MFRRLTVSYSATSYVPMPSDCMIIDFGVSCKGYIGADYPAILPIHSLPPAELALQETVHFPLAGPGADEDWATIVNNPEGFGWVRLGPDDRLFALVMFHQLHCLRQMQRAIADRNHPLANPHHIRHCINYLRQAFLCKADFSLESGDFMARNYSEGQMGDTMACEDWSVLYDYLESNYEDWKRRKMVIP